MVSGWFQSSDYSSQNYENLSADAALTTFTSIDLQQENRKLQQLVDSDEDWCPFGFGLNYDDGYSLHAYKEQAEKDEYTVRLERHYKTKFMGFLPVTTPQEKYIENISFAKVKEIISQFYEKRDALFEDDFEEQANQATT